MFVERVIHPRNARESRIDVRQKTPERTTDWFKSYMTDRQQLTFLINIMPDMLHEDVYSFVLGPLFCVLYIGDIKSVIQNTYFHFYADDTLILKCASDKKC